MRGRTVTRVTVTRAAVRTARTVTTTVRVAAQVAVTAGVMPDRGWDGRAVSKQLCSPVKGPCSRHFPEGSSVGQQP